MEAWLGYILKVNACLIGFYAFYWLFLRRSTFLHVNRVYLLAGLVGSFVIPLLKIPLPAAVPLPEWDFEVPQPAFYAVESAPGGVVPVEVPHTPFPVWNVLTVIYFTGVFTLLLRLIVSLVRICRLKRRAGTACVEGRIVRTTDGTAAFSFFRTIFLPRSGNLQLVLEHEKVHVRQGHTCDLLFMEAAALLLWFNPVVSLYRRALKLLHEYLADEGVVRRQGTPRAYLECVLDYVQSGIPGLPVHAFGNNNHSLKKRIAMMMKHKMPRRCAWIYLLALPLAGALMFGFSARAGVSATEGAAPEQAVAEQLPADDPVPSIYPSSVQSVARDIVIVRAGDSSVKSIPSVFPIKEKEGEMVAVSGFGQRRGIPHTGIDIAVSQGTEVVAAAPGRVAESKYDDGRGNYIVIRHNDEYSTLYSHLEKASVKAGDTVQKGQVIGTVGSTGRSTGPHLHYEVHRNGKPVNPWDYVTEGDIQMMVSPSTR